MTIYLKKKARIFFDPHNSKAFSIAQLKTVRSYFIPRKKNMQFFLRIVS